MRISPNVNTKIIMYKDLLQDVNAHLEQLALDQREPRNLYEPMAYILRLKGKRIRPMLCLLAYQAVSKQKPAKALNLACALELFHNFTLMHDDIMDNAPLRRDEPTVHVKWDVNTAILSGDAMFAYTLNMVVEDFPQQAGPLIHEFTQVALGVCEGQMEDMNLAIASEVTIPQYVEMIRKKTAVLLGGSLALGAIAGGADKATVDLFRRMGEQAGIGFQLHDDLMDAFPPAGFGKQQGGDIIENKKTYLVLRALELANEVQLSKLVYAFTHEEDNQAKVETVLSIFRELGIDDQTEALAQSYFDEAARIGETLNKSISLEAISGYLGEIAGRKK